MYSIMLSRIASIAPTLIRASVFALAGAFALSSVSGCALLSDQLDTAAKGAGKLVTYYCENVTLPEAREEIRAAVNTHAQPHSIAVECAEGGPILKVEGAPPEIQKLPDVSPGVDGSEADEDDADGPIEGDPIF